MLSQSMIWPVPGGTLTFSILALVSAVRSFGMLAPGLVGAMCGLHAKRQNLVSRRGALQTEEVCTPTPKPPAASVPTLYPPQSMATHFPPMAGYGRNQAFSVGIGGPLWVGLVA